MAYINPIDLIADYIKPPTGAINAGFNQGIQLRTLQNAEAAQRLNKPLTEAHTALYNQQIESAKAVEKARADELDREQKTSAAIGALFAPKTVPITGTTFDEAPLTGFRDEVAPPVAARTVDTGQTMKIIPKPTYEDFMAIPGMSMKEREGFSKREQTAEGLTERLTATKEVNQARTDALLGTVADKIESAEKIRKAQIESAEKIAAANAASREEIAEAKRTAADAVKATKPAPASMLNQVADIMKANFLPFVPADKRQTIAGIFSSDPLVSSVNMARMYELLPREKQLEWDRQIDLAYDNVRTMNPAKAVQKAKEMDAYNRLVVPPAGVRTPAPIPAASSPGPNGMTETKQYNETVVGGSKKNVNTDALLAEANKAIAAGADPVKVKQRLKDVYGVTVK